MTTNDRRLNIKPALWGGMTWKVIHAFAESMPETLDATEQAEVTKFLQSLTTVLPCLKCRKHLEELFDTGYFPRVQKRDELKEDLFRLHNKVSQDLGKPVVKDMPNLNALFSDEIKRNGLAVAPNRLDPMYIIGFLLVALVFFMLFKIVRQNVVSVT